MHLVYPIAAAAAAAAAAAVTVTITALRAVNTISFLSNPQDSVSNYEESKIFMAGASTSSRLINLQNCYFHCRLRCPSLGGRGGWGRKSFFCIFWNSGFWISICLKVSLSPKSVVNKIFRLIIRIKFLSLLHLKIIHTDWLPANFWFELCWRFYQSTFFFQILILLSHYEIPYNFIEDRILIRSYIVHRSATFFEIFLMIWKEEKK